MWGSARKVDFCGHFRPLNNSLSARFRRQLASSRRLIDSISEDMQGL